MKKGRKGKYKQELKLIEEENGILTPERVVEAARSEKSPLHNAFEWDDTEAGRKYRLIQARFLINSIKVEYLGQRTDGYVNAIVTVDKVPTRGYVSAETAFSDDDIYKQVIRNAARELRYWQSKYKSLETLKGIINPDKLEELEKNI